MKRNITAACALLSVTALLATGCASTSAAGSGAGGNTVTVWARDSEKGFINLLANAYNASHTTKVKVTIVPAANFVQKFGTAVASGSGPDVASIDLVYLPYFASVGALQDITDTADKLPYHKSLSAAHQKLATYNGRTYALPFTAEASVLYYNKTLFKKAGLDPNKPPTTYAQIVDDAKKIRALGSDTYGYVMSGGCGGCNIFEFTPHIWASGGDVLSADGKHAQLDSPQVADALRFYRELYTAGTMPDLAKTDNGANASADFLAGKIGMIPLGAFFVQSIKAAKGLDVGVAPLPGKDGGSSSFAGGDEIALAKGARNKAKALDFITWATGTQAQTILADNGIVPVRTDLIPTIYAPKDPMNKVLGDAMATGRTPYSTVENSLFNDNNGPWIKMIDQAVFGGDIAGAQAAAQKQAQAIIDGSR